MTATNNLPTTLLADSIIVNYQGSTRILPISNLAQLIGDGSGGNGASLAALIEVVAAKADRANAGKFYADRASAVAAGQEVLIGALSRIVTIESDHIVWRAPYQSGDDPLFATSPYWGVIARTPKQTYIDQLLQIHTLALRDAGISPLTNIAGTGDAITAELGGSAIAAGITSLSTLSTIEYVPAQPNLSSNPTLTIAGTSYPIRNADGATWPAGGFVPGRSYLLRRRNANLRVIAGAVDQAELSAERLDRVLIDAQTGTVHLEAVAGTGDAITAAVPAILAERGISAANLRRVSFVPLVDNTGPATINIAGQGAVEIRDLSGAPLVAGGLKAGRIMTATKVASRWHLTSGDIAFSDLAFFRGALSETTASPALLLIGMAAALGKVLEIDPSGGLHLVGLGGRPVQEMIQKALEEARTANRKVGEVAAPALRRMSEAQHRTYDVVDMTGGLHLAGLGGKSVQEYILGLQDRMRSLASRLRGGTVLDAVADLGCDPHGREPCALRINRTLDRLADSTSGPVTIFFPRGHFLLEARAVPRSRVSFVGSGPESIIMPAGPQAAFWNLTSHAYIQNCVFANIAVSGELQTLLDGAYSVATKAFYIQGFRDCLFTDLYLYDTGATALGIDFADRSIIQRVRVQRGGRLAAVGDLGGSGIGIGTGWLSQEPLIIADCITEDCRNYGIFLERQHGSTASHAIIHHNISRRNQHGIGGCGTYGTIYNGNQISDNIGHGLTLHQGTNNASMADEAAILTGNQIMNNGDCGIDFDAAWRPQNASRGYHSSANRIIGNGGAGHRIIGPDVAGASRRQGVSIGGDEICGNGGHGIHVVSGRIGDLDIDGARVFDNAGSAVHLDAGAEIIGGSIHNLKARDHRGPEATQTGSITGGATLTDVDIAENHGVGCTPINLTGAQTRVTFGRNPGM